MPRLVTSQLSLAQIQQSLIGQGDLNSSVQVDKQGTVSWSGRTIGFFNKKTTLEYNKSSIRNVIDMIQAKGGAIPEGLMAYYCDDESIKDKPLTARDILKLVGSGLAGAKNIEPMEIAGRILKRLGLNSSQQAEKFFDKYFHIEAEFKEFEFADEKGFPAVCNLIHEKLGGASQIGFREVFDTPECLILPGHDPRKEEIVKNVMAKTMKIYEHATKLQKEADSELGQLRSDPEYDKSVYVTNEATILADFLNNPEFAPHREVVYRYITSFKNAGFTLEAAMLPLRGKEGRSQNSEDLKDTAKLYFKGESISPEKAKEFSNFYPAAST